MGASTKSIVNYGDTVHSRRARGGDAIRAGIPHRARNGLEVRALTVRCRVPPALPMRSMVEGQRSRRGSPSGRRTSSGAGVGPDIRAGLTSAPHQLAGDRLQLDANERAVHAAARRSRDTDVPDSTKTQRRKPLSTHDQQRRRARKLRTYLALAWYALNVLNSPRGRAAGAAAPKSTTRHRALYGRLILARRAGGGNRFNRKRAGVQPMRSGGREVVGVKGSWEALPSQRERTGARSRDLGRRLWPSSCDPGHYPAQSARERAQERERLKEEKEYARVKSRAAFSPLLGPVDLRLELVNLFLESGVVVSLGSIAWINLEYHAVVDRGGRSQSVEVGLYALPQGDEVRLRNRTPLRALTDYGAAVDRGGTS
ncbi:hypothetical protein DFH09DRAFT_1077006 [Mycena vulgaris]|nr:hypothetical protein DFH09DRAFT_1077006 [Mycena vulgaris]